MRSKLLEPKPARYRSGQYVVKLRYVSRQTSQQRANSSHSSTSSDAPVYHSTQHVPARRLGQAFGLAEISDISARSNYSSDSAAC